MHLFEATLALRLNHRTSWTVCANEARILLQTAQVSENYFSRFAGEARL